jgi:tripartite-type tricarboxylate transporter receptor subunit TctC
MKRRLACAAAAALTLSFASAAAANDGVTTFVVNFPAGGPLDVAARVLADTLRTSLGGTIVVTNRAGASGNIGAQSVAKAAGDGGTILFTTDAPVAINPLIFPNMPFKSNELKAVALIGSVPSAISVSASSGIQSLADLVKKGRQAPVTFSSSGSGSPAHIGSAMFAQNAKITVNHIPYKGGGPAALALAAGEVDAGVLSVPGILAFVSDGRVRPLAVTSKRRSAQLPAVPTTTELGYPDVQTDLLFLAMVPAQTPDAAIEKLQSAIASALATPAVKNRLSSLGIEVPAATSAAAAAQELESLRSRYARIVKEAGIKVE